MQRPGTDSRLDRRDGRARRRIGQLCRRALLFRTPWCKWLLCWREKRRLRTWDLMHHMVNDAEP
jgi:hypothetical protein